MTRVRRPIHSIPVRQHGFTLIELVAAFVIFALGFGILLQILSSCLHSTAQSADYTRAALWAQSLLDPLGVGETLREGASSGRFDDKYSWQLRVAKIDPPAPIAALGATTAAAPGNANGQAPVVTDVGNNGIDLYQLELSVNWGSYYMTHSARFVTLRAVMPDNGNPGNPNTGNPNSFTPYAPPPSGARKK
jgi:general secretion pathway protein I